MKSFLTTIAGLVFSVMLILLGPAAAQAEVNLQVLSVQDANAARQEADRLFEQGVPAFVRAEDVPGKGVWNRVYVGPFETEAEARAAGNNLKVAGTIGDFIVKSQPGQPAATAPASDVDVPVLRLHFREDRHSDEMMAYGFILEHVNRMGLGADGSEPRRLPRPLAECWKDALNGFLRGRKVAVKEPDDIALSLLTLLDRDIDIRCIIAKDAGQARLFGADVIVDADIDNHDVDTILVASAAFHREMCAELRDSNRQRGGRCRILDMYAV